MPIKKFKAQSPDPFINKIPGDTEFARLAHLNNLVDQINAQATPSTNIYNSNGTLTGNRTLTGANNSLFFTNISTFALLTQSQFSLTNYDSNNQILFSGLPNYNGLIQYTNFNNSNLNTSFIVGNSIVKTQYGSLNNDIGFILDFANNFFGIGNNFQDIFFYIDNNYKTIISQYNGNVEGLKLDFIQRTYELGNLDLNFNRTIFIIDDNNEYIKTRNQGNDIGLKLDFANNKYVLGDDQTGLGFVADLTNMTYYFGDYGQNGNTIEYNSSTGILNTNFGFINEGLHFEMSNGLYQLGQITGGNESNLIIDDANNLLYTRNSGSDLGIVFDFQSQFYKFGQLTGGNTTYLTIDDAANYPVQLTGTNISSGTAGAASGQFLKIKVGGVDYKIALLNP